MSDAARKVFGGLAKGTAPEAPLPKRATLGVSCLRCASDPHVTPVPEAVVREGGKPLCEGCVAELRGLGSGSACWASPVKRRSADTHPDSPYQSRKVE